MWSYVLLLFTMRSLAECDCGYTVNSTHSPDFALFTDLFETDFLHLSDVTFNASYSTGWMPQDYYTSASQSSGPYGMAKESTNLIANYVNNQYDYDSPGVKGPDPGLELWVRSPPFQASGNHKALVPSAEIVSERDDILYGSFRIAMKTSPVDGTCAAFYFYRNDSQELDVEILSIEQHSDRKDWPVHLVAQNTTVVARGSGAVGGGGSVQEHYRLPSAPNEDYNEYRFDWLPGRVDWYVNGGLVWSTTENVPSSAGRVHISHWSNGNPFWSHGPPTQEAVLTVSYVKAYFNSTNSTRNDQYTSSCPTQDVALGKTCEIPTQDTPPNPFGAKANDTGHTFFFTKQPNMTPNQTIYQPQSSAARRRTPMSQADLALIILFTGQFTIWGSRFM